MGRLVACGGVDLWVEQWGHGEHVLLIPGLGDTHVAWRAQLQSLAKRYRVTAFDNRGSGRSSFPDEQITLRLMAADVCRLIAELQLHDVHLVGFSMGGAIAQEVALACPDALRSLVLVDTWARADAMLRGQLQAWRWMAGVAPGRRELLEAFGLTVFTRESYESGIAAAWIQEALEEPDDQSVQAYQATVDAALGHDTVERLPLVAVPTLVIAGLEDQICPPSFAREIAALVPGARLEIFERAGHQPFQEDPERFDALVDSFWRSLTAA